VGTINHVNYNYYWVHAHVCVCVGADGDGRSSRYVSICLYAGYAEPLHLLPATTHSHIHIHTIVTPPADTLKQIMRMSEAREGGLVLLINPQWSRNESANIISDFSIFPWQRRAAEDFLATFTDVRSACRCE
jgi:hypothetical protein